MTHFDKSSGWNSCKSLLVKHVSCNFSESCLTRFYTRPTGFTPKHTCHVSRIVWSKSLFIYWFEYTNTILSITQKISATCAVLSKLRDQVLFKSVEGSSDTHLNVGLSSYGSKNFNTEILCVLNSTLSFQLQLAGDQGSQTECYL